LTPLTMIKRSRYHDLEKIFKGACAAYWKRVDPKKKKVDALMFMRDDKNVGFTFYKGNLYFSSAPFKGGDQSKKFMFKVPLSHLGELCDYLRIMYNRYYY
jgi:hypothetical protein